MKDDDDKNNDGAKDGKGSFGKRMAAMRKKGGRGKKGRKKSSR